MKRCALWSADEDRILREARARGLRWSKVAALLPGRNANSCGARGALLRDRDGAYERATEKRHAITAARGAPVGRIERPANVLPFHLPAAGPRGCAALDAATRALFAREVERRGVTIDVVVVSMQQGPEAAALWRATQVAA